MWKRYVDDTYVLIEQRCLTNFADHINHGRLQKFFQEVNVNILLILFRFLTMQCKWMFRKTLLFLLHKENVPCCGSSQKLPFVGSNS